jgi:predicted transcriptional regulator
LPHLDVEGVDILNEGSVVAIIRFLDSHSEARASELKAVSGNYDRLKILAERMDELGLITIKKQEKPRLTYIYKLTEKGEKVAIKLVEIDQIMSS